MGSTVFAEGMGFFHKGSGGKGVAPGDVCLSPPSPPAGPVPVPYVNMLSSSDLTKGSKSVKIEGNPTALESSSEVATSTGNEPATQGLGAGVITHKIKGKGVFKLWSFVVKVEGKGVCRHGDTMEQNTASPLPNTIDTAALVNFRNALLVKEKKKCTTDYCYDDHYTQPTGPQKAKAQNRPCWECKRNLDRLKKRTTGKNKTAIKRLEAKVNRQISGKEAPLIADHQPTQKAAWYAGGCNIEIVPQGFKDAMKALYVRPHCSSHSNSQPGRQSKVDNKAIRKFMNARGI
ncbi:DUF4150 domain-containing protein [Mesorhizobium sp. M0129]|uniref:DUF4150 domain-containing protein n=1 Tax=Mesorhizobium sp. M0129 TaxID=2956886 RepID=UPI00333DA23B